MLPRLNHRAGHYALLLAVGAALGLINLGGPSLWDIDEGHNAEAAREMLAAGNWVIPTFNFQLRSDKPALLYWLQILAYQVFGVGEFAARLPSALAALVTVLLTYELGRRLFDPPTGLLAGLVLASSVLFCGAGHFANPDALLCMAVTLALLVFVACYLQQSRRWFVPAAAAAALAVLAKGPIGLALPVMVTAAFLVWERRLTLLLDRRLAWGVLAFVLVALPWYALVGAATRFEFLRQFLLTHNVGRFRATMEGHRGNLAYYLAWLAVGLAPWSAFLVPTCWYELWRTEQPAGQPPAGAGRGPLAALVALPTPYRLLWCWVAVVVLFFSVSATKLPNYVLPAYPALAVLVARFLERWRRGEVAAGWTMRGAVAVLALVGATTAVGLLCAGGALDAPFLRGRYLPGLEACATVGFAPLAGAAVAAWCLRRQWRGGLIVSTAVAAVLFVGTLAAWGSLAVDAHKAVRPLADDLRHARPQAEVRVGCYRYYQPSLVFYCRREVHHLDSEPQCLEFLDSPLAAYLFVPAAVWAELEARAPGHPRVLRRHYDLYQHCDVMLIANR